MKRNNIQVKSKVILVDWFDIAYGAGHWDPTITPAKVSSVGYLVRKTKKELIVAMSRAWDSDHGGLLAIPMGCVKSIKRLQVR